MDTYNQTQPLELPPRARRIPTPCRPRRGWGGTTSACAENTLAYRLRLAAFWNYLRVRGEYPVFTRLSISLSELPPRARRILVLSDTHIGKSGTTSACAENTSQNSPERNAPGNYLRVRGEYSAGLCFAVSPQELPPRARRIRIMSVTTFKARGTTSACAENTWARKPHPRLGRNYLRVRGEYHHRVFCRWRISELPPRARRIRGAIGGGTPSRGTTSACAENTSSAPPPRPQHRNYLRVRGEY